MDREVRPEKRRKLLLDRMEELAERGSDCSQCSGTCCTFVANSMQITPLQALDIYHFLRSEGRWSDELIELLQKTVKDYRLDYEVPTSRGRELRRSYTCPFFVDTPLGCSLPREIKPYGCLGFNPQGPGVKSGENCVSEREILEKRENMGKESGEDEINCELQRILGLFWEKRDIPRAILDIDAAVQNLDLTETEMKSLLS